jgi:Putative Flp pilus-assembly TadE/G-like
MSDPRDDDRRNDKGSVMVVAALALVALVLFAALAVDVGFMWSSRTQSQNVSDAAALAAASTMLKQASTGQSVTLGAAVTAGTTYASQNSTVANPSVTVKPTDFNFGFWDLDTRTLDTSVDQTKPEKINAVRVDVRMDGADNQRSPGLLSRLFQKADGSRPFMQGFEVKNTSVAYLGYAGDFEPGAFCLPVAIDSCKLSSDNGCGSDFCARSELPPTAGCTLEKPQPDTNGLLCGDFSSTGEQDMCFTALDGSSPSINGPKLQAIVDNCSGPAISTEDSIYIDNGDKTSTVDYIRDKFYGCGKFKTAAGKDEYGTGFPSSWVVKLPVVECQDATNCAGGDPQKVIGGVCFEVREVIAPAPGKVCLAPKPSGKADRIIKGRPLCPYSTNPKVVELYNKYCGPKPGEDPPPSRSEGCDFGFRATRPVLVE